MTEPLFQAPSIERMGELLPAFEFISVLSFTKDQAIYVANQKSLDRHVAVKIHAPQLTHDADFREAFETMARQMAKLNHPNLVGVFNSGVVDGMLYLIMEHVPGRTLAAWVNGKAIELPQALSIMSGICAGLSDAHANSVLHGGLSMGNILLNPQLEPKIDNFGFADSETSDGQDHSSRFMAPELWDPQLGLCVQSDIYSLGAIFYELITGQPHSETAKPADQLVAVKPAVSELCMKATAKDLSQRLETVEQFQEALEKLGGKRRAAVGGGSRKAAGKGRPAGAGPVMPMKVPSGWRLGVHLVIIAILCYAIHLAWDAYKDKKAARAAAHRQQEEEQAEKLRQMRAAEEKRQRERERAKMQALRHKPAEDQELLSLHNKKPTQVQRPDRPSLPPDNEVIASLNDRRKALRAGERSNMPVGTKSIGGGHYLLIPKAMTWPEAASFAEDHGASLVIPDAYATLQWLRTEWLFDSKDPVWIGAGSSGIERWSLADGTPFTPVQQPEMMGPYLAMNPEGKLVAQETNAEHRFIVEWRKDGSCPGELIELLKNTAASIAEGKPIYPPGTHTYGLRNYLIVSREVDWQTAHDMARLAGGHLAAVRGVAENYNMRRMVGQMPSEKGIWMGASHKQGAWSWVSGEAWDQKMEWAKSSTKVSDGMALMLSPGNGYKAADAMEKAPFFIIEWSRDAASNRQ